jgi:hypothetical protein
MPAIVSSSLCVYTGGGLSQIYLPILGKMQFYVYSYQ